MSLKAVKFNHPLLRLQRYLMLNNFQHIRIAQASTNTSYTSDECAFTPRKKPQLHTASTQKEIDHHASLSATWWDINGPLHGLHKLNEIRVPFVRNGLLTHGKNLQDKHILEVGCGGGILTEALARLSVNVTGIDLGEDVITAARKHLEEHCPELKSRITYNIEPIEVHAKTNANLYDAVVCSEVLEHIDDKVGFLTHCVQTLKPGGSIFISTLNKTIPLWIVGVILAENVIGITPKNTHHWNKLAPLLDVQRILSALNCQTVLVKGYTYNVFHRRFEWIKSTKLCYAIQSIKV